MQIRALSGPARFPAWRSAVAWPRAVARSRPGAGPAGQIVCLRLTGQLRADTAEALLDAVSARVRAAMPAAYEVVLDLTDIPAVDDGGRAALLSLGDLLVESHTRLRLVLPEAEARAALRDGGTADAIGANVLHTSVRAAVLAAHAALPGPALVTPALRALLGNPPEQLLLPYLGHHLRVMKSTAPYGNIDLGGLRALPSAARGHCHESRAGVRKVRSMQPEDDDTQQLVMAASGAWQTALFLGVVTLILGLIVSFHPTTSLNVIAVLLGVLMIISGLFHLTRVLDTTERHRVWLGIAGLLFITLGVVLIRHLDLTLAIIGLVIGLSWICQGVAALIASLSGGLREGRGWWIFFGIVSLIAGIVVISSPATSLTVLAVLAGTWFVVMGLFEIGGAFILRHAVRSTRTSAINATGGSQAGGSTERLAGGEMRLP